MRLDRDRLLQSLGLAALLMLLLMRPWPGQTEPGDVWGLFGGTLVGWVVFYRAWPAFAGIPPRILLARMATGLTIGLVLVVLAPRVVAWATGWGETKALLLVLVAAVSAAVIDIALRLTRRRRLA